MPTPRAGYYTSSGERVPGVTTIIGRFKDAGGLIHWSSRLAFEPYMRARAALEAHRDGRPDAAQLAASVLAVPAEDADYRSVRDKAAGIGTIVHARIDAAVRGRAFDPAEYVSADIPDPIAASAAGFQAFQEWAGSTAFTLAEGEMPLVSDVHRYGGTPDVVLVRGERCIGDWKSGDLYAEQLLPQLAAYHNLVQEHGIAAGDGAHAISVNKNTGGFTHRYFTPEEVAAGWRAFLLMRELYDVVAWLKNTSKRADQRAA